ncbi:MAG: helix-turn-helix domain-containing protein [Planctomycetaceae bacterium]|nr:helix-turn-helix domain-containing protein [Planctomycetaceae bacterium]
MTELAGNLRRLLARCGLTIDELAAASGVDARTIRGLLLGRNTRPHARTLTRLAGGLGVDTDEFFRNRALDEQRAFDADTNPLIESVLDECPRLFEGWTPADLEELYSHFGEGGSLTREGAVAAATAINRKRELQHKIALILESGEADVLVGIVELLYQRIQVPTG